MEASASELGSTDAWLPSGKGSTRWVMSASWAELVIVLPNTVLLIPHRLQLLRKLKFKFWQLRQSQSLTRPYCDFFASTCDCDFDFSELGQSFSLFLFVFVALISALGCSALMLTLRVRSSMEVGPAFETLALSLLRKRCLGLPLKSLFDFALRHRLHFVLPAKL